MKSDEGGERRVQEEAVAIVEWRAEQQRETTVDGLNILQILARRTPNPEKMMPRGSSSFNLLVSSFSAVILRRVVGATLP